MDQEKSLIIIDDDTPFRERLTRSMEKKGFIVEAFGLAKQAIMRIKEKNFNYAIIDMRLEDISGLELIKFIQKQYLLPRLQMVLNNQQVYLIH